MVYITKSTEETKKLAKILLEELDGQNLILLIGDLGAGKTAFTKGIANELGIVENISSPTYGIKNEYKNFIHYDLFLSEDRINLSNLLDEDLEKGIVVIEWADKLHKKIIKSGRIVKFKVIDENTREVTF